MRIVPIRVAPRADDAPLVEFTCGIGTGFGRWRNSTPPERGAAYDVELDVNEFDTLDPAESAGASMSHDERTNRIVGLIESIDDDGMLFVRLSIGCLMLVETPAREQLRSGQWIRILVPVERFSIWPFGWPPGS